MKKLLSLPPNLVECFHDIEKADQTEWFCTSDPIGSKLGSGGGTAWLLEACCQKVAPDSDFLTWLGKEKRNFTSCRRAESSFARICAIRQNSYSHSCIPVGQRTTAVTKSAFPPAPFI